MSATTGNGKWATTRVSTVARVLRGKVRPKDHPELPFVGMDNVEAHTMRLLGTVPSSTMKSASVHFRPGDVLYGRLRPYLNKVLAPDFEGLASAEFIPLTTPTGVEPKFLQYRLNAADFVTYASHLDEGDRPRVDYDQIGAFEIELPPSGEQRRIVEAIESYFTRLDDAVATLDRVQRNLKRYRASVLKAAVEGRLVSTEAELARAEGRDYEPASVLLERILAERRRRWEEAELAKMQAKGKAPKDDMWKAKYKEPVAPDAGGLPDLPAGWCWASVEQLASSRPRSIQSGPFGSNLLHSEFQSSGRLVVGIDNVQDGYFSMGSENRISEAKFRALDKYRARAGDVLVTVMATIGRCCVIPNDLEPAIITKHVYRITPQPELVSARYLHLAIWGAPIVRGQIFGKAQGQTRPGLNGTIIKQLCIPLPPRAEQDRIVPEADRLLSIQAESTSALAATTQRCDRLRQAILKWAFEGRLVDQDPTDEPASRLLERIQVERESANGQPRRTPRHQKARSPRA